MGRREDHGYYGTSAWRKLRDAQLAREPYCRPCLLEGKGLVEASTADHVIPRRQGGEDALENLRSLCTAHHNYTRGAESVRTSDSFYARQRELSD